MAGDANPFEVFGIEPVFQVDEAALHAKFLELSAQHHPDRYTDPGEQAEAADRAARVNEAYQTLTDPERRAGALLAALGGPSAEEEKSLPQDLLTEMMELRERQEEATASNDTATIQELTEWAKQRREISLKRVAMLFKMATMGEEVQLEKLTIIRIELNALRYYERMLEQLPAV